MSISGGRFSDPMGWLWLTLMTLPGIILAITFHEFAHAYSAYKLGDDTPKIQRRVTLNPLAHLDPIGIVCIIFVGFGWGRPVMVDPRNFSKRKRDEIIVSLAGVVTNFILAIVLTIVLMMVWRATGVGGAGIFGQIVVRAIWINLILMVFNLLPIPPLDGFSVVSELLGIKYTEIWFKLHRFGFWILIPLILLGVISSILSVTASPLFDFLISVARNFAM